MAGSARQKIDPQTRDMFDPEIERPDHDRILTTLFSDDAALLSLLAAVHHLEPLKPFGPESRFVVDAYGAGERVVSYQEAVRLTGTEPKWANPSPIRISDKKLEVPMIWWSENGRYSRIMGFCDVGVGYEVMSGLTIDAHSDGTCLWAPRSVKWEALIEVKGAWPTAGNLIRQLNLYSMLSMSGFNSSRHRLRLVVGPDASMNDLLCQHGYRLATFDSAGTTFSLEPGAVSTAGPKLPAGTF